MYERGREVEPALHAAGVALDHPVRRVLELDQRQQLPRALLGLGRAEAEQAPVQDEQLAAGLARVEAGLLERDADPAAGAVGIAGDVDARDLGVTAVIDSSVVSMRTVVDLPAPLGPRKPKISPVRIRRSTPRTASTVPSRPL